MRMPFGRHAGLELAELPRDYLLWLATLEDLRDPLASAVDYELCRRDDDAAPRGRGELPDDVRSAARQVVDIGFRTLALRHHPDIGGATPRMVALNQAAEWLRSELQRARMA